MVIDQPPAVEALTWMQEAVHRYGVAPYAAEQADAQLSAFQNGRIAMVFGVRGGLGTVPAASPASPTTRPPAPGPEGARGAPRAGHDLDLEGLQGP